MFERLGPFAAIPLRLALGAIVFVHGAQRVFGMWGGAAFEESVKTLASIGLVPGTLWAGVAGVLEVILGSALVVGVLTRWVAMVLAAETMGALILVHLPTWISSGGSAIALDIALLGGLLSLVCSGAERYALDERIRTFRRLSPPWATHKAV